MEQNTASTVGQDDFAPGEAITEQVLTLLQLEAKTGDQSGVSSKNALFARLYFFTTRAWAEHAKSRRDSELLYLVVEHFHRLYDRYVLEVDQFDNAKTAFHWQVYRKLVGREKVGHNIIVQLIALMMGIRAHTRYDLAEAICFADESYRKRYGHSPDSEHFRSLLFGKKSDQLFRQASVDFVGSLVDPSRHDFVVNKIFKTFALLWLPIFQMARKMAWKEARLSISSGTMIRRRSCHSNHGLAA